MEITINTKLLALTIPATDKLLLSVIAAHLREGRLVPTMAQMARQCGLGERTAQRCILALEAAGWLDVKRTPWQCNRYSLRVKL